MTIPQTSVVDDFNRVSLGANWTTGAAGTTNLVIGGSTYLTIDNTGGNSSGQATYNVSNYSLPFEVWINLKDWDTSNNQQYFYVHFQPTSAHGAVIGNGYACSIETGASSLLRTGSETVIRRRVATTWNQLMSGDYFNNTDFALTKDATDKLLMRIYEGDHWGVTVENWVYLSSVSRWFRLGAVNDYTFGGGLQSASPTTGYVGIGLSKPIAQPNLMKVNEAGWGSFTPNTEPAITDDYTTYEGALPDPVGDAYLVQHEAGLQQTQPYIFGMKDPVSERVQQNPGATAHNPNTIMDVGGVSIRRR